MRHVAVEAYADKRRTHGGYVVILLRGVTELPPQTSVRLKPGDGGVHDTLRRAVDSDTFVPLTTRITADGAEIVIGPVGAHFAPAAPVRIEIADAGIHGEFLWPCVVAPVPGRRRRVLTERPARAATPAPATLPTDDSVAPVPPPLPNPTAEPEHAFAAKASPAPPPLPTVLPHSTLASEIYAIAPAVASRLSSASASPAPTRPDAIAVTSLDDTSGRHLPRFLDHDIEAGMRLTPRQVGQLDRRWRFKVAAGLALCLTTIAGVLAVPLSQHAVRLGWRDGADPSFATASIGKLPVHCAAPVLEGEARDAGMMRLVVRSSCHAGQEVHIAYGGVDQVRQLDAIGELDTEIDCFAGTKGDVTVRFDDGTTRQIAVTARDLDRVSKVALIWQAPVNLDLHAFEYGAQPGESGHRWNRAASTLEAARHAATRVGRGSGFISTAADGRTRGDQVEVYTFVHADGQSRGIVSFALDHAMDGAGLSQASCGDGALAEVGFRITVHSPTRKRLDDGGLIAPAECGTSIAKEQRYRSLAAWQLEVAR